MNRTVGISRCERAVIEGLRAECGPALSSSAKRCVLAQGEDLLPPRPEETPIMAEHAGKEERRRSPDEDQERAIQTGWPR